MRRFFKSKTMMFAFALAMFGVIETQVNVFEKYIGSEHFGLFALAVSLIVGWLRFVTTLPLDDK